MIQVMGRDISVVAKNELCTKPTFKAIISADDKVSPGKVAFKVKPHKVFIFDAETDERIYVKLNNERSVYGYRISKFLI